MCAVTKHLIVQPRYVDREDAWPVLLVDDEAPGQFTAGLSARSFADLDPLCRQHQARLVTPDKAVLQQMVDAGVGPQTL